jgi:hypothetical protein
MPKNPEVPHSWCEQPDECALLILQAPPLLPPRSAPLGPAAPRSAPQRPPRLPLCTRPGSVPLDTADASAAKGRQRCVE